MDLELRQVVLLCEDCCSYKRDPGELPRPSSMGGYDVKMAIYESGRGFSPETKSAGA